MSQLSLGSSKEDNSNTSPIHLSDPSVREAHFNELTAKEKKRRKQEKSYKSNFSISQQFAAIAQREPEFLEELDDAFSFDPETPLTTREKFLILHLANLTCKQTQVFTDVMENELRLNILLRACLHSKSGKLVIDMIKKAPELVQVTLPTSGLSVAHLLASTGNDKALDYLCGEYKLLVDQPANNNLTPLHLACLFGLDSTVRLLLSHRAFIETECIAVPFTKKVREGQGGLLGVLNYYKNHVWNKGPKDEFLTVGSTILQKSDHYLNPLLLAVIGGSVNSIKSLIANRALLEHRPASENYRLVCDAFVMSCIMGHEHLAVFFLENQRDLKLKYDVDIKDINGNTPMILNSKSYGMGPLVELLCTYNANINQTETFSGNTALHFAIVNSHVDVLRAFIKKKKSTEELAVLINASNPKQLFTPLQLAYELHEAKVISEVDYKAFFDMLIKNDAKDRKVYSEVVKEGWLYKEGHVYKTVRQRWFILRKNGTLSYYKDIRKLKSPSGEIQLYKAIVQKEPSKRGNSTAPLSFSIYDTTVDKKFFIFVDTEDNRDQWLDAVNFCVSIAKNPNGTITTTSSDATIIE
jgi:ankyrin repeat protein